MLPGKMFPPNLVKKKSRKRAVLLKRDFMGFLDSLKGKKEELDAKRKNADGDSAPEGRYSQACAVCGGSGTEKKWMGQHWHKKCLRQMKKAGKKMI